MSEEQEWDLSAACPLKGDEHPWNLDDQEANIGISLSSAATRRLREIRDEVFKSDVGLYKVALALLLQALLRKDATAKQLAALIKWRDVEGFEGFSTIAMLDEMLYRADSSPPGE